MQSAEAADNDGFVRASQAWKLVPSNCRASPADRGGMAAAPWRGRVDLRL